MRCARRRRPATPTCAAGAVRGRLTVVATQPGRRFSGRELTLLGTLADACGAALDTTETQTPVALAAHVDALSGTLGAGRAELRWRGGDFVALAAAVGRRVRLEEAEQAELELAARLLDVGLLRVPGDGLDRPRPPSATELP